ncbi:hypothetical protein RvY_11527 [Ramazzottius varieornatus]|uniref:Uncharacterized protein n=1 Tax=Ramazzottius varieornatus TaxID=947166 RepID=A0A1D1VIG7_RAMVA|nr:hypothetical protein RvY_11527 [Ramazzottius varieornatus]
MLSLCCSKSASAGWMDPSGEGRERLRWVPNGDRRTVNVADATTTTVSRSRLMKTYGLTPLLWSNPARWLHLDVRCNVECNVLRALHTYLCTYSELSIHLLASTDFHPGYNPHNH